MKADYKNWVPKGMIYGLVAGTGVLGAGFITSMILTKDAGAPLRIGLNAVLGLATLACGKGAQWSVYAFNQFSYNGKRQMSKQIIEGTAEHVKSPMAEHLRFMISCQRADTEKCRHLLISLRHRDMRK